MGNNNISMIEFNCSDYNERNIMHCTYQLFHTTYFLIDKLFSIYYSGSHPVEISKELSQGKSKDIQGGKQL